MAASGVGPDGVNFHGVGYPEVVGGDPERGDLIRLAAATEVLLSIAERVDGEIADEAIVADLYELRDRAYSALRGRERREANGSH